MGKDISETDVFSFNEEFHNKLYKIKIATVSAQKESEPEKLETRHKVRQPGAVIVKTIVLFTSPSAHARLFCIFGLSSNGDTCWSV